MVVGHADRGEPGILSQVRHPALLVQGVAYLSGRCCYPKNPSDADCHHRSQVARPEGSLARDSADPDEWRLGAGTLCCRSSPSCWRPGSHPFAPSATVGRLRECQIYKLMEQGSIAQWIRHVRRTAPSRCIPTERSQIHLDLGRGIPLCRHRQGSDAGQWTLQGSLTSRRPKGIRGHSVGIASSELPLYSTQSEAITVGTQGRVDTSASGFLPGPSQVPKVHRS